MVARPVEDKMAAVSQTELPGRTLVEELAALFRSRIQNGELVAGDRLPAQRELARDLGVARPTLQHALRVLESQGYAETKRGATGGTFVLPLDEPADAWFQTVRRNLVELEDILCFRAAVESEAAALAATRRSSRHLEGLRAAQTLIAHATTSADFRRGDSLFHSLLGEASGSPRLERATRQARGELFSPIDRALRPRLVRVTVRDHQVILHAVEAADPVAAAAAVRAHIDTTRTELRAAMERTAVT
ncbi:MAG: FadR/GntR family transcriptional regulator [Thermoleophilia bacterium]